MAIADNPTFETGLVSFLLSRNGNRTCVTTVDGEPMRVSRVEMADLPSVDEWDHYAELGGIGLIAGGGKYSFFSTEIAKIEDIATGAIIYARKTA